MKAATAAGARNRVIEVISIHAAREGGDYCNYNCDRFGNISIHAAREGGDYSTADWTDKETDFNPRRP